MSNEQRVQEFYNELKTLNDELKAKENEIQSYLSSSNVDGSEVKYQLRQLQKQDAPVLEFTKSEHSDYLSHYVKLDKDGYSYDWNKFERLELWKFIDKECARQANKLTYNTTPYIFEFEYRFYLFNKYEYNTSTAPWKTLELDPAGIPLALAAENIKNTLAPKFRDYSLDTYRLDFRFKVYLLS